MPSSEHDCSDEPQRERGGAALHERAEGLKAVAFFDSRAKPALDPIGGGNPLSRLRPVPWFLDSCLSQE